MALGLHPQLVDERFNEITLLLDKIRNVKYIGEVGLDFNNQYIKSKEKQIEVFTNVIKECSKLGNKVLSIHSVKSYNTLRNNICILHWFTGNENQLRQAIELGCNFSINSKMLTTAGRKQVILKIPEDKILVETDVPFIKAINHCHEIYEELNQTIIGISNLKNRNLFGVIQENSRYVFGKFQ